MKSELKLVCEDEIIIEKDLYWTLMKQAHWLDALQAAGVNNWEGNEHAIDIFYEDHPEYDDIL